MTEEEKANIKTDQDKPVENLGVPVMIVLTKLNYFGKKMQSEIDRSDHFDIVLNYVQKWCVKYGCAGFSFHESQKEQAVRIFNYAVHRIQDTPYREVPKTNLMFSNIEDEYFLFPSGLQPPNLGNDKENEWDKFFPKEKEKEAKKRINRKRKKAEGDDQVFLKLLEKSHKELTSKGSSSSGSEKSSRRRTQIKTDRHDSRDRDRQKRK
eukprot:UN26814